jgi:signal transduction histidine kinase
MLDTSRVVTGKIRLDVAQLDLSSLVGEAVDNIRPSVIAKGVDFDVVIAPAVQILGDRDRLRQIIWNLLTNAVKFTPRGGGIELSLSIRGSFAEIVVRDTGFGFSADSRPHIFKRFWQADSGRMREHGGLGLGLALAKDLTELHGGTIEATSEGEGKGAAFLVTLPLRREQTAHGAAARPALRASGDSST